MGRILAISSYVASGHVGLSAIIPALQAFGHEVIGVPSVVLSCHYGYTNVGGLSLDAVDLGSILDALRANGAFNEIDAIITGYMGDAASVSRVEVELERIADQHPDALYLCDPVIGDDPKGLYVTEDVAAAIRGKLVSHADVITPNRFELNWLSGRDVRNAEDADRAADAIGAELAVITSVPTDNGFIANVSSDGDDALLCTAPRLERVPQGTGDLFAALMLGHLLSGADHGEALALASAGVQVAISESVGSSELRLISCLERVIAAPPAELRPVYDEFGTSE